MEESSPNVLSNVKALRPFMHLGMGSPVGVVWVMVFYFGETLHTRDWRDDLLFWASGRIRIATVGRKVYQGIALDRTKTRSHNNTITR